MLYFITSNGLVSEESVLNQHDKIQLRPIQPFLEIPLMRNQDEKDLLMGNYDFCDDTKYYQPALVGNVIIRKLTKIIMRGDGRYGLFYKFKLQWFSSEKTIKGYREFIINHDIFHLEDLFSIVIPFINWCMATKDKNTNHHILMITRLMGIRDGFNALFNSKISSSHISYHKVRSCSIGSEFRFMKVNCRYTYQYRVGRDDYESEHMTIRYKTNYEWADKCSNSDKNFLQDLLYDTIKRKYQTQINVKKENEEYVYSYRSWSDYNFGPAEKDFDYSEEECKKMKEDLMKEIDVTYKQYFDDFVGAYKKYTAETIK